jgi:transposase
MTYCKGCLSKQQKINELEEEITSLKSKLHYQERTAKEGFFGSSTPSSKIPVKPNSPTGDKRNRGGAKPGHKGHGRSSIREQDADKVEKIHIGNTCPDCGSILEDKGTKTRAVIDCQPVKMKKVVYYLERKRCPRCKKIISARPQGVLAKCLYSNQLLAYVAVQHYIYGNTLGQIEKQTGIGYSSLVDAMHQLSKRLKDVPNSLIEVYRDSEVKHADETGWRTDGNNGYAWLFCTPKISIFRVRRTVKDLEKDFPENAEIKSFVEALAPQLTNAISLRTLDITDRQFKRQAAKIKNEIINITNRQAKHPAIQKIQDIFREKADRLYHWAEDRNVPADNNLAERELRPLVIARKISFGSQSDAGAKTREILMTVLHTLKKTTVDVTGAFKSALDKLAEQGDIDIYKAVFKFDSS